MTTAASTSRTLVILLSLGLTFAGGWILSGSRRVSEVDRAAAQDALMQQLLAQTPSALDSHPDAVVGHMLLPDHEIVGPQGEHVATGTRGLRERDYALPKPSGLVRIVLLGDSYMMGWGVEADERVGAVLEDKLAAARQSSVEFECLHIAVTSWNVLAEVAFLRRQLHELKPDLVLHVTVANDLDDVTGVRGFGGPSGFSPAHPERADVRVRSGMPTRFNHPGVSALTSGLDFESRARYRAAGEAAALLASEVEAQGGTYRMIASFGSLNPVVRAAWDELLGSERLLFIGPKEMGREFRLGVDPHWNPRGHARAADLLFGLIQGASWLPQLQLTPAPEAATEARLAFERGREQALSPVPTPPWRAWFTPEITPAAMSAAMARQVYGGIRLGGDASPYVSLVLLDDDATELVITGNALPHAMLADLPVRVFVDGKPAGQFELQSGESFDARIALPAERGKLVHIQLETDDFVYTGDSLRNCVSYRIDRIALASAN